GVELDESVQTRSFCPLGTGSLACLEERRSAGLPGHLRGGPEAPGGRLGARAQAGPDGPHRPRRVHRLVVRGSVAGSLLRDGLVRGALPGRGRRLRALTAGVAWIGTLGTHSAYLARFP